MASKKKGQAMQEKGNYKVEFFYKGTKFAEENYCGTVDYVEDCAMAYIAPGESAIVYDAYGEISRMYKLTKQFLEQDGKTSIIECVKWGE